MFFVFFKLFGNLVSILLSEAICREASKKMVLTFYTIEKNDMLDCEQPISLSNFVLQLTQAFHQL